MIYIVRRWLFRTFGLVTREQHDTLWNKWSEAVRMDLETFRKIQSSLDILVRANYESYRDGWNLQKENTELRRRLEAKECDYCAENHKSHMKVSA